ncbi:hypothetical protein [Flavobacterium anhuiense]|uniref:hypothetical protein n=1 Tax=Flavobacterium anhuiense TaxID=459526 RepID=UPI0013C4E93B|nr:hypothetical protein [Flavobacterium anhuiense]
MDNNNDFPMLKSIVNTERELRKILDDSQLKDYTALLERCFDSQKIDAKAAAGTIGFFFGKDSDT